ncbi:MAG TPA: hypothetical protein VMU45_12200 [Candidatus Eisenbacteria bacterium]|nr:hypothetical protein [Candidatus Eisenbacteria bacterium]
MIDVILVPENTVVTAKGDSEALDVSAATNSAFLATLSVTKIVEQESIEVSFFTSADGTTWEAKPVASLPQQFYVGEYPLLVDLSQSAGAKFLRAHWEVNRWGRGPVIPNFEVALRVREIPADLLEEARAEAASRR